jgi:hypothetical protein
MTIRILMKHAVDIVDILLPYKVYRVDFNSLEDFTALRFTAAGVPPAARCIRILPMNQLIKFGIKGTN